MASATGIDKTLRNFCKPDTQPHGLYIYKTMLNQIPGTYDTSDPTILGGLRVELRQRKLTGLHYNQVTPLP